MRSWIRGCAGVAGLGLVRWVARSRAWRGGVGAMRAAWFGGVWVLVGGVW
jgi:hypothetical protein